LDIEWVLFQLFILVLLARVAGVIFEYLKQPPVVGEILMGVIIGNTILYDWLRLDTDIEVFQVLAELGIIFLLFMVGLETKFSELRKVGRTSTSVAVLGVIIPFIAGYLLIVMYDLPQMEALFMGAAMVATSVGITARVIRDMGLMEALESRVILGAAVIDDVLGMIVLAVVVGVAASGTLNILDTVIVAAQAVLFVVLVIYVGTRFFPRARKWAPKSVCGVASERRTPSTLTPLSIALVVCFGLSALASFVGLAAIIGAFLAGMIFAEFSDVLPCEEGFNSISEFLVPFFFLFVGVGVDLSSFMGVLLLAVIITLVAIATKFLGCALGSISMGRRSASIVGVGMVPRGEVGIIVAQIGLNYGAISADMFSIVVAMSVATTLIAPPLLSHAFGKKRMNERSSEGS